MSIDSVVLSEDRQLELNRIAQSRSLPAGYVFRARLILMLAEGASFSTIEQRLGTTAPTISRWKQRFLASGMDGLNTNHPGQSASVLTPKLRARILSTTRKKPKDGSTHWSCRKLAAALGVSKDTVHRVWKEAGLKPHRLERYMASDDPDFEAKALTLLGCTGALRGMRLCFVSMRRPPFRRWIDSIRCCRFRRAAPSAVDLNTAGTEPYRCMRRWTPRQAAFTERPLDATPAATL
jgi:transposase